MNITPSTVYWITRLDDIRDVFVGPLLTIPVLGFCGYVISWVLKNNELDDDDIKMCEKIHRDLRWSCWWLVAASLLWAFIPTGKQAAAILVAPAVLNSGFVSETVPKEAREIYDLAKTWLKEQAGKPETKGECK